MRVAFVDTTLTTPPTGGSHTFLVAVCAGLVRRGWEVSVVTRPGPERTIAGLLEESGVEVVGRLWRPCHLPQERALRLAGWVNAREFDAYVVSNSSDEGWLALPRLERAIATLSIAHNDVPGYYAPVQHYGPFLDCAIGVSDETRRRIVRDGHMPAGRSRRIPYGVERISPESLATRLEAGAGDGGPLRIGYVGRLVQTQKRVLDFLPLVRELERRRVDFELHLIGDGSERPRLEEGFAQQEGGRRVRFWGWLASGGVRERLAELDVFLLLSEMEGMPVALLEAMGHAVVPVVTRIASGIPELVRDEENGFLVTIGDIGSIAGLLADLARDRGKLRTLGHAAWSTTAEFATERMVDRYASCLSELVAPGSPRGHRPTPGPYPVMPSCRSRYPSWLRKIKRALQQAAGSS